MAATLRVLNPADAAPARIELPHRTRDEINNPAPSGERHDQAIKIAVSLLSQGLNSDAVFAQLRGMYERDVSDRELDNIVNWAVAKVPSAKTSRANNTQRRVTPTPARVTAQQAERNVKAFLNGWYCTIADLWHASSWHPSEDWHNDSAQLIAALYSSSDYINIVTAFVLEKTKNGHEKACPHGAGETLQRDEWLRRLRDTATPCSAAGAWIRLNPVLQAHGSGEAGAHTDADVASHRFLLLESDCLPIDLQFSLWARLKLPVVAMIDTGGRSIHAWVKVDCTGDQHYRELAAEIYKSLVRFGICRGNKNPSRLSRLPGVKRAIGGVSSCEQRLLYLNPSPAARPIFG